MLKRRKGLDVNELRRWISNKQVFLQLYSVLPVTWIRTSRFACSRVRLTIHPQQTDMWTHHRVLGDVVAVIKETVTLSEPWKMALWARPSWERRNGTSNAHFVSTCFSIYGECAKSIARDIPYAYTAKQPPSTPSIGLLRSTNAQVVSDQEGAGQGYHLVRTRHYAGYSWRSQPRFSCFTQCT